MMNELVESAKDSKVMAAALATIYDSHVGSRDSDVRRLMRDALVCLIVAEHRDWSRRTFFEQAVAVAFGRVLRSEADLDIWATLMNSFSKIIKTGGNERAYFNNELGELLESLTDEQRDTIFECFCEITDPGIGLQPVAIWPHKRRSASAKRRQPQCPDTGNGPAQCSDACYHAKGETRPPGTPGLPCSPGLQCHWEVHALRGFHCQRFSIQRQLFRIYSRVFANTAIGDCAMNYLHTQFIIQELIQRSPATAGGTHPSGQRRRSSEQHRPGSRCDRW